MSGFELAMVGFFGGFGFGVGFVLCAAVVMSLCSVRFSITKSRKVKDSTS